MYVNRGRGQPQPQQQQPPPPQNAQPQAPPQIAELQPQGLPGEPAPIPNPVRENRAPPPRHLATKQTPLRNDPMYLDAFVVDGEHGLVQESRVETFSPSFDSFLPLVRCDYQQIVSANRPFGKEICLSVYTYYCIQHLWARIIAIRRHRRRLTWEEQQYLENFEHDALPTTQPVNDYLRSIGDFTDTTGTHHQFDVPSPNEDGHFGVIDENSHNYYEAYPAPKIALEQIVREFDFDGRDPIWELAEIRPRDAQANRLVQEHELAPISEDEEESDGSVSGIELEDPGPRAVRSRDMPTVNLLGWYPLSRLSANQRQFIAQTNSGGFIVTNERFSYVPDLMNTIAPRIAGLANYKTTSTLHESKFGSKAQEAYLQIERFGVFNRAKPYCDGEASRVRCLSVLDARLATGMRVFGLRIRKESPAQDDQRLRPWACYDYGFYENVPEAWNRNRNRIFSAGLNLLTHANKSTVIADRRPFRTAVLRTAIKERNRV